MSFHRDLGRDERAMLREVVYAVEDKFKTLRTDHHNYKLEFGKLTGANCPQCVGCFER